MSPCSPLLLLTLTFALPHLLFPCFPSWPLTPLTALFQLSPVSPFGPWRHPLWPRPSKQPPVPASADHHGEAAAGHLPGASQLPGPDQRAVQPRGLHRRPRGLGGWGCVPCLWRLAARVLSAPRRSSHCASSPAPASQPAQARCVVPSRRPAPRLSKSQGRPLAGHQTPPGPHCLDLQVAEVTPAWASPRLCLPVSLSVPQRLLPAPAHSPRDIWPQPLRAIAITLPGPPGLGGLDPSQTPVRPPHPKLRSRPGALRGGCLNTCLPQGTQ